MNRTRWPCIWVITCSLLNTPTHLAGGESIPGQVGLRWQTGTARPKTGGVKCTPAFSPNDDSMAMGWEDGRIVSYEATSGRSRCEWKGHTKAIYTLVYSPDGKCLAAGGADGVVRIWDPATGTLQRTLEPGNLDDIFCISFSSDGKKLAASSNDRAVRVWEFNDGKLLETLKGMKREVAVVAFSPDGQVLAGGGEEEGVCLWKVSTGAELRRFSGAEGIVLNLAFSRDGKLLAAGDTEHGLHVWETESGRSVLKKAFSDVEVVSVAFCKDERQILSAQSDGTLRCLDLENGKALGGVSISGETRTFSLSPQQEHAASVQKDGRLLVWDFQALQRKMTSSPQK